MNNNSQSNQQKFIRQAIACTLIVQAVIISVKGNLDVLSGKPTLDVIQWMMTQGIELIVKAYRNRKSFEESDRSPKSPNN